MKKDKNKSKRAKLRKRRIMIASEHEQVETKIWIKHAKQNPDAIAGKPMLAILNRCLTA